MKYRPRLLLFTLAFLANGLAVSSLSAQFLLTDVSTPTGSFTTTQTLTNVSIAPGEFLLVAYGDDQGGSGTASFDGSGMTSGWNISNANTTNMVFYVANDTGSALQGDVVIDGAGNNFMYGAYTLDGADPSIAPAPVNTGTSGANVALDFDLTGLTAGQFVFTSASNGNGSSTLSVSPGSVEQQASTGGSVGDFAVGSFEVSSSGNQTFTWSSSDNPFRTAGGAIAFTPIPEPGTAALFLSGLACVLFGSQRRRN